jgi:hypothetical protein
MGIGLLCWVKIMLALKATVPPGHTLDLKAAAPCRQAQRSAVRVVAPHSLPVAVSAQAVLRWIGDEMDARLLRISTADRPL